MVFLFGSLLSRLYPRCQIHTLHLAAPHYALTLHRAGRFGNHGALGFGSVRGVEIKYDPVVCLAELMRPGGIR